MARKIDALIFDLDGTLIDSSDGVVAAVNYSLRQVGAEEQAPDTIKAYIGYPLSQMYPEFTDAPFTELYRHFQYKAAETVVSSTVMLEGVAGVLTQLGEQGYRMAIATTKVREHVDGIVGQLEWSHIFQSYVGGDEVEKVKPSPDAFLLALERLGASRDSTLVVGDTVNDVHAAQSVSLRVAAVASPYGNRQVLLDANPDFFLESITELPALLSQLNVGDM